MDLGYARVSTTHQDLERQIATLTEASIPADKIWVDKKTGAHTQRPGLDGVMEYAREGDRITVCTLDRLARNMRDTLNLIHDLAERGIGIRTLKDPIPIDSMSTELMARMSMLLMALFAEMERVWNLERVSDARSRAGRSPGRPSSVSPEQLAAAQRLQANGESIRAIAAVLSVPKTSLARALAKAQ